MKDNLQKKFMVLKKLTLDQRLKIKKLLNKNVTQQLASNLYRDQSRTHTLTYFLYLNYLFVENNFLQNIMKIYLKELK